MLSVDDMMAQGVAYPGWEAIEHHRAFTLFPTMVGTNGSGNADTGCWFNPIQ